jgi:hypothetical protein
MKSGFWLRLAWIALPSIRLASYRGVCHLQQSREIPSCRGMSNFRHDESRPKDVGVLLTFHGTRSAEAEFDMPMHMFKFLRLRRVRLYESMASICVGMFQSQALANHGDR